MVKTPCFQCRGRRFDGRGTKIPHVVQQPIYIYIRERERKGDFPGGAVVTNPPANVGDTGSNSGLGRSHMPRSN